MRLVFAWWLIVSTSSLRQSVLVQDIQDDSRHLKQEKLPLGVEIEHPMMHEIIPIKSKGTRKPIDTTTTLPESAAGHIEIEHPIITKKIHRKETSLDEEEIEEKVDYIGNRPGEKVQLKWRI